MKNIIKSMAVMIAFLASAQFITNAAPAQQAGITYVTFYDALAPYGTWIDYPEYGYVWHPDVEDFRPYVTNGHWEFTEEGWYWESGYEWGWAPFHYGYWFYDEAFGWLWEPGYDWSTAHVDWGVVGDNHFAWAAKIPMEWDLAHHNHEWNMVERKHFYDRNLSAALVPKEYVNAHAPNIRPALLGPDVRDIELRSGTVIKAKTLRNVDKKLMKADDNSVYVYRPRLSADNRGLKYRKATREDVRPVTRGDAWPSGNYQQQRKNIEKLPIHIERIKNCETKAVSDN